MVGISFDRYDILIRITFSHRPDESILFWHGESLSVIELFSVPEKLEVLLFLIIVIKQNERSTPTYMTVFAHIHSYTYVSNTCIYVHTYTHLPMYVCLHIHVYIPVHIDLYRIKSHWQQVCNYGYCTHKLITMPLMPTSMTNCDGIGYTDM